MLARGPALVLDALAAGRAAPASTVYTLESVRAVCRAAPNAELRRAYLSALAGAFPDAAADIRALQRTAIDAMAEVAVEKLGVLSGAGSAVDPERKDD